MITMRNGTKKKILKNVDLRESNWIAMRFYFKKKIILIGKQFVHDRLVIELEGFHSPVLL